MKFIKTIEASKKAFLSLYGLVVISILLYVYTNAILVKTMLSSLITIFSLIIAFYSGFVGARRLKLGLLGCGMNGLINMLVIFVIIATIGAIYSVVAETFHILSIIGLLLGLSIFCITGFVAAVLGALIGRRIKK